LKRSLRRRRARLCGCSTSNRSRQTTALQEERDRLTATLEAEDRRLDTQLQHDRERLATQLRHERRQADIADLRRVLEQSLNAAARARQATMEGWWDSAKKEDATRTLITMETQLDRLRARLGKEEPIVKAYETMSNVAHALSRLPSPALRLSRDQILSMPEVLQWGQAYHEYAKLAQGRVGSRDKTIERSRLAVAARPSLPRRSMP
jgi:hypothetical protein